MDARAVSAAADLGINTLNVWVARGLVPGMTIGSRGLQRDFDLKTATAIIIMAELARFGLGALLASEIAAEAARRKAKGALIRRWPRSDKVTNTRTYYFDSDAEIPEALAELRQLGKKRKERPPTVFVLVDLEPLATQMRTAHEEWERGREARDAKADD